MKLSSQSAQILRHLQRGRTLTAIGALVRFQCFRLAARIYELKRSGYAVGCRMKQINSKRIAEYYL